MAVVIDATQPRLIGGLTGREIVNSFVNVKTAGARELAQALERAAIKMGKDATPFLTKAAMEATAPIIEAYKRQVGDVTGNLAASTRKQPGKKKYSGVGIAVVGPEQTGNQGSTNKRPSGNHAWLNEFGSGRRKPGTQGRRTYINVHQMINRKMTRHSTRQNAFNNDQFAAMSKGYYFLMGSKNEPTRQKRAGSGYPHDFAVTNGKQHPMTLHPGETYAPMPAKHCMENAINQSSAAVLASLKTAIQRQIDSLTKGGV